MLEALGSRDLEQYARAEHAASSTGTYNFGRDLFFSFISRDLDLVETEYRQFMKDRILGNETKPKKRR